MEGAGNSQCILFLEIKYRVTWEPLLWTKESNKKSYLLTHLEQVLLLFYGGIRGQYFFFFFFKSLPSVIRIRANAWLLFRLVTSPIHFSESMPIHLTWIGFLFVNYYLLLNIKYYTQIAKSKSKCNTSVNCLSYAFIVAQNICSSKCFSPVWQHCLLLKWKMDLIRKVDVTDFLPFLLCNVFLLIGLIMNSSLNK